MVMPPNQRAGYTMADAGFVFDPSFQRQARNAQANLESGANG
jgi:hypothetical protein